IPAEDIRAQQILDRVQNPGVADHLIDPGKQHMAPMAHLALDRAAGPRLVVLELAAKCGDFALTQGIDRKMVAALALVGDLASAQQFRHSSPPVFLFYSSKVSLPSGPVKKR